MRLTFISVSAILSLFLLGWGLYHFKTVGGALGPSLSVLGVLMAILLTRYYKWFRQKSFKVVLLFLVPLAGGVLGGAPRMAQACSVCYGDPNSTLSKGALVGVAFLAAVITMVLVFIVLIARDWLKRAQALSIEL